METTEKVGVILQPGYLPWLGFFDLLAKADVFIIYDDVQYTKRDWRSRNRIKFENEIKYLTVPIKTAGIPQNELIINQAQIDNSENWAQRHCETLRHAYKKAEHFDRYSIEIFDLIKNGKGKLIDLQVPLINYLAEQFKIKSEIVYSSKIKISTDLKKSDRLIALCKPLGIKHYLTGDAAADYIDINLFEDNGIKVYFHNYQHPTYRQLGEKFIPYLSAIDLLFNEGEEAANFFQQKLILKQ